MDDDPPEPEAPPAAARAADQPATEAMPLPSQATAAASVAAAAPAANPGAGYTVFAATPGRPPGLAAATAATAGGGTAPADKDAAWAAAIARGGRYRIEGLIGEGGMGRVFRAHDGQLQRAVAIKMLTASDPTAAARFAREAQLQARVEHPNVAKVYETGEADGARYIVMQLIPGRPLGELSDEMSLEQRVRIVQRVAEGLHEAHRLGLVHGDVKPSNVLVVEEAPGVWHPYVLDFGIAREVAATPVPAPETAAAAVTGTPAYMAPEQVRAETLDRRTDVYALGVTLYRLVSGKLPFSQRRSIAALRRLLDTAPTPLRQAAPLAAPDLEAIVMKCIETSPARRYATARALADDLVRFLDGEPVQARRQTLFYRLAKKARKHRALLAVSAAALAGVLLATGWAVHERWQTARRAALAQRFGREEERFEWTLRAAYELPLHDTTPERAAVRRAIERLGREVTGLPRDLRAPGDAAIGRGLLALGDETQARGHLERAWRDGYRGPEVAYTLGLTLVHAYQEALARARQVPDATERRLAVDDADRALRAPALAYLRLAAGGDLVAGEYLEGLLAYVTGDPATSRRKAAAALARLPWLYEALVLEAQAWRATADQTVDETARGAAQANAEAALARAARLGASDARNHLALCETRIERLQAAIFGRGDGVEVLAAGAGASCGDALRADPRSLPALVAKAQALTLLAGFELDHGGDPSPRLAEAETAARAAIGLHGERAAPFRALAAVWNLRGRSLRMHGGDVRQALLPAIANLGEALRRDPNDWQSLATLGSTLGERGMQEYEHGDDATPSFAASTAALQRSAALEPRLYRTFYDLGRTYGDWGEYLANTGKDSTPVQLRAIAAYRKAIEIKPDYAQAYNSLGAVYNTRGSSPRPGVDPQPLLAQAEAALRKAIEIQPTFANPRFNLGLTFREMGHLDVERGRDPWPHLRQAIAAFEDGLRLNPKIFFAYLEMGRIYEVGATYDVAHHRSPDDAVREAVRLADRSLAMQPDDFMALKARGEARLLTAEWDVEQRRSPDAALAQVLPDLERAAAANVKDYGVYELFGEASLLAAKGRLAAGEPADPQIDRGLNQLAKGRQVAGEDQVGLLWIEAQLHLLRAQAPGAAPPRAAAARRAVAAFEAVQKMGPSRAAEVAPGLAQARRLAATL